MRHGARVLPELRVAQGGHFADTLHGGAVVVGHELILAEDREALLERQLEPVP